MPRPRRNTVARHQVLSTPHRSVLLAAATNYKATPIKSTAVANGEATSIKKSPPKPTAVAWQTTAWGFYDTIGEFRYAVDWIGHLLSRVTLMVYKDGKPTTDSKAIDLLDALFGGAEGQADMLRQIGRHWTVAGDCYVIGDSVDSEDDADWLVGAATQTTYNADTKLWKVNTESFKDSSALVIRLYRPHPTDRTISDSPTQAVLPILSEIDGLTKYVAAQIDSRLAGNGILLLPSEMTFGSAVPETPVEGDDPAPVRKTATEFVETLFQVASMAIQNREDPNSLIPIVLTADGDQLQHVRHMPMEGTTLQTQAIELRNEAIRRLALGMDMPPEILTGTSDMNHWSSWQIEEAAIKSHLEPLLDEICASLTTGYLREALDGADASSYTIEADTTAIRLRPNRSKEALELYNLGRLSAEALLRENGFDPESDLMKDDEFRQWLTIRIAGGSASPEMVLAAIDALGVKLTVPNSADAPDPTSTDPEKDPNATRETRPTPSTAEHPTRNPPPTTNPGTQDSPTPDSAANLDDRVVFAGAIMVDRALERAGNRMKTKIGGQIRDQDGRVVPAARAYRHVKVDASSKALDDLLIDAWSPVPRWAADLKVEPTWLATTLDGYTRGILQGGAPHSAAALQEYLVRAKAGV